MDDANDNTPISNSLPVPKEFFVGKCQLCQESPRLLGMVTFDGDSVLTGLCANCRVKHWGRWSVDGVRAPVARFRSKINESELADIVRTFYEKGSVAATAKEYQVANHTMRRFLKRHKVQM